MPTAHHEDSPAFGHVDLLLLVLGKLLLKQIKVEVHLVDSLLDLIRLHFLDFLLRKAGIEGLVAFKLSALVGVKLLSQLSNLPSECLDRPLVLGLLLAQHYLA